MKISNQSEAGFTVVELLVVVIIGTLILSGVYQFFGAGLTIWNRTTNAQELRYQSLQDLRELTAALRTAYSGGILVDFIGVDDFDPEHQRDADAIQFITADQRSNHIQPYDLSRVGYYLDPEGRGLVKLRDDYPFQTPAEDFAASDTEQILPMQGDEAFCHREIVALNIQYYDGGEWLDEWDSRVSGRLPQAVAVTIGVADPNAPTKVVTFSETVRLLNAGATEGSQTSDISTATSSPE